MESIPLYKINNTNSLYNKIYELYYVKEYDYFSIVYGEDVLFQVYKNDITNTQRNSNNNNTKKNIINLIITELSEKCEKVKTNNLVNENIFLVGSKNKIKENSLNYKKTNDLVNENEKIFLNTKNTNNSVTFKYSKKNWKELTDNFLKFYPRNIEVKYLTKILHTNDLKINNQITNIPNLNNRTLNIHNKSDDLVKLKILDALIKEINKEINKEKSNNFMITMTKK